MTVNFQKKKLKNGIMLMLEKRDLPVVSLSISNPLGSASETEKNKGVCHFIEHLLFTGTKTRTHEDISREIEKKGGILNAFTANQVTSFWFKLPSQHLFSGLDILTDMLNNASFPQEKFEKEKKVILEEIKMYHDDPRSCVSGEMICTNLYGAPFGKNYIIGSPESLNPLTREDVMSFFQQNYSPENFVVTVVGDADFSALCTYLEEKFVPKKLKIPKIVPIKLKNAESSQTRPGIDQANFVLAMHAPLKSSKEFPVLQVLDGYLANGMSSRLFLEIREKRGLAYTVRGEFEGEKDYSHYTIYVGTTKEAVPKVKELVIAEFKNIDSMTESDLKQSKERLIGLKKVYSEESSNVMNELMYNELISKAEDYYKEEEKINAVTLSQVKNLSKKLIKSYSTAAIIPQ